MRRRDLITLLGGAAAWPLAASAQQPGRTYRLAFLANSGRQSPIIAAFFDELSLNGFVKSQNLNVVVDGFEIRDDQIDRLVGEVIKAAPDVVLSPEQPARVLQRLTSTTPIVAMTEDMLEAGLGPSLARPGGNITGISLLSHSPDGKRQDNLIEAGPGAPRKAGPARARVPPRAPISARRAPARAHGIELLTFALGKPEETVSAIDAAKAAGAGAINFLATPLTYVVRAAAFARVAALRLPAIYQWPEMAEEGGLAGYGPRFPEIWRQ